MRLPTTTTFASLGLPLILGSGSATRKLILGELGLSFEVIKPNIDEKAIRFEEPSELVMALGKAKATALQTGEHGESLRDRGAILLTGDQVVVCNGSILEKPETAEEARDFIASYGLHAPSTVGSCVVTDAASGQQWSAVDVATVHFRPIPSDVIDDLIEEGTVFQCAGGLMVEHPKVQPFIERMDGPMDSIMGLCKATVSQLLDEAIAARQQS